MSRHRSAAVCRIRLESNPDEEKYQNLNHANIAQKFGTRRKIMSKIEHDRLRLRNNNVAFVSQKLAAKIEAHDREAELKREKLRVIAQNKQRLASKTEQNLLNRRWRAKVRCAVKKEVNPLTSEMLQDAKPVEQKRMIGERLFRKIQAVEASLARKITGMLLKLDNTELLLLLSDQRALMIWVNEALRVLKSANYQQKLRNKILTQHKEQMSLAAKGIFNVGASVSDRKGTGSGVNSLGV